MSIAPVTASERGAAGFALLLALGWAFSCSSGSTPRPSAPRPNVLFILTDDQAPGTLGFEGNPVVRTPNIDRLALEGTTFSRAYVPLPQCAPSRAAILTGRYPHRIGVLSNKDARLDPEFPTLATALGGVEYRTGLVGKWHLGDPERPQGGFDDFWIALDREAAREQRYFEPHLWVESQLAPHAGYLPEILTDYAIRFIDRPDTRPFFLYLAYKTPHAPVVEPPQPELRVDPGDVPLPPSIADDLSGKPGPQRLSAPHQWFQRAGPEGVRAEAARYHAMISALDRSIGRLIRHLEARGLERETLIIFSSDNGLLLGEHQMVRKGPAFYEELIRVPLILRWPGVVPAGRNCPALVSSLDLFPTLAALAGARVPPDLPGRNLWSLVTGEAERLHDELFFEYREHSSTSTREPMLGVVTARHKYVRYLRKGEEELYDLEVDPYEMENLSGSPRHAEELRRLRQRVDRFEAGIGEPFWH